MDAIAAINSSSHIRDQRSVSSEEDLPHPLLKDFYRYWRSKFRGGRLPRRQDIEQLLVDDLVMDVLADELVLAFFRVRNKAFRERPQRLRLGNRRLDALMQEQARRHVSKHRASMRGCFS